MELDLHEVPTTRVCEYMLSPPSQPNIGANTGDNADGGFVVYCIDISGSMAITTELPQLQGDYFIIIIACGIRRKHQYIQTIDISYKYRLLVMFRIEWL